MNNLEDEILYGPDGEKLRKEALRVLEAADCLGALPTPVDQVMSAANLEEIPEEALDERFLANLRRKADGAGKALKRALSKVLGVFDAGARLVYIAPVEFATRKTFLRLHEIGHGWLKWQQKLYSLVEDCELTIAPEIAERFEAEANLFASEVLFQLDEFKNRVDEEPFGLKAPLKHGRKFGASAYASIRRYVTSNDRCCAVIVLNQPEFTPGSGFTASLRRVVSSRSFFAQFGELDLPNVFTPTDTIGGMVPTGGRRMTGRRELTMVDRNSQEHLCVAEGFDSTRQIFILVCLQRALTKKSIVVAA